MPRKRSGCSAWRLRHPRFDAEAVNRVRVQMLQQIEQDKGDPEAVAENSFYSFYFGANPYGHPIDGDARGLAAITPADLKTFARSHWVRGGLKIALVGDARCRGRGLLC